jgi:hypothetical protein
MPKAKGKVAKMTFATQAKSDYPQREFADKGCKFFATLQRRKKENKKKLSNYEEYLVLKHFPKQQQMLDKEQKAAKANDDKQKSAEAAKKARAEQHSEEQAEIYRRKVRKFLESMLIFEIESQIHKGKFQIDYQNHKG